MLTALINVEMGGLSPRPENKTKYFYKLSLIKIFQRIKLGKKSLN